MAFDKDIVRTPTTIGPITLIISDPTGAQNLRSIAAMVTVLDQTGEAMRTWDGDLSPHLTAGQITALRAFLDALRTQAAAEMLP